MRTAPIEAPRRLCVAERARGTARTSAHHLAQATGARVVTTEEQLGAHDVVAVGAPRRFGCLWRRSRCGLALDGALWPVLVAARSPRPFRSCVIVQRAAPAHVDLLPQWLERLPQRFLAVALDAPSWVLPAGHCPDAPSVFAGVACGIDAATKCAARVEQQCRRRLAIAKSLTTPGSIFDAVRLAAREAGDVDLVCVAHAGVAGFGLFLRECIDAIGSAVLVLPDRDAPSTDGPRVAVVP